MEEDPILKNIENAPGDTPEEKPETEEPPIEPVAETPAEEPKPEEAPAATAPGVFDKPKKKGKAGLVVLIILFILLAGCAAVYFLLPDVANDVIQKITGTSQTAETKKDQTPADSGIPTPDEPEAEEVEITDSATIAALFRNVLILHHPGIDGYLEYAVKSENYTQNRYFGFGSVYTVAPRLYSELTINDKFYITTLYMNDQGQLKPASSYGVPNDYYASVSPEYCKNNSTDNLCTTIDWMPAASEDEVAEVYANIFGEKPTSFEKTTNICGSAIHDAEYHIYYFPMAGCGGADGPSHQVYVEKYSQKGESAFVYVRGATINETESSNVPVYKAILGINDVYDSETDQAITPDESLVYSYLGSGGMGMYIPRIITTDNYTDFASYRFVFEKSGENYIFKTVEKL